MITIALCIKQVANFSYNAVDLETGLLKREQLASSINQNDLSALQACLELKENLIDNGFNSEIHVFSMGPQSAKKILKDSFAYGVDKAYLINDKAFIGSDVISTSYTLCQAIKSVEKNLGLAYHFIVCGAQTSDGGTAFVHAALATHLGYSLITDLKKFDFIDSFNLDSFCAYQEIGNKILKISAKLPLVLSVLPESYLIRIPSLKGKIQAKNKEIEVLSLNDFEDQDINNYGLKGARTKVVKSYAPKIVPKSQILSVEELGKQAITEKIFEILSEEQV